MRELALRRGDMTDHADTYHNPALQRYISLWDRHREFLERLHPETSGEGEPDAGIPLHKLRTPVALV